MQHVNVYEVKVIFHSAGEEPSLLLIHRTRADWQGNCKYLIDKFSHYRTVIYPNYPGSGKTQSSSRILSVESLSKQIITAAHTANEIPFNIMVFSLSK
ncbi:hypothetical protein KKI90_21250 [Xenorhabdus bovienii]|uniref:alpha/beta fold hydrolase n=1 Tax=Xenorhabdus bovienii TaxID=40576 RepID=UPI00237CC4F9|nr:hypothetical protein [Xenorhabdus bovienii]MDE1488805.1 hypothetical protein [Xenorhabdus bovienii]MDE9479680.1 hypothetical protein [Xenorhabdus bovienii]MDE9509568.1 hypothetical protein [Xenorhabdus bovienii]